MRDGPAGTRIGGNLFPAILKIVNAPPTYLILSCALLGGFADSGICQDRDKDLAGKIDAIISAAYQSAAAQFPCKVKTRGKAKMLHWQQVDECLNGANDRIDWEDVSRQIQEFGKSSGSSGIDISAAVESSLSTCAIPFDKVFLVKDIEALLPLTNSLLKFLPSESLQDFPVYDKSGAKIGTFSGVYSYEKAGGLTAGNTYRMSIFQYTDLKGEIQAPSGPNRLLLDSYGVPWKGAISQPGFRLNADRLNLKR
jgi:hypothetical protein